MMSSTTTKAAAADIMEAFEKELSKISGLNSLKVQLQRWAKQLVLDQKRRDMGLRVGERRPPHMAFLGNPGTGKTMVARTLGKLLHMLGTIPTDKVVEVQRTDLVARYVGQTGPQTREMIKSAEGGILFVDEAYRLMPQDASAWDFGLEALEEIMSFMDTKQVVVIFAGYRKQMDNVISANDGFRRRVTKFFYFDDFSCLDLANILSIKMSNASRDDPTSPLYGFKLHPSCTVEAIAETIERESTKKQRGEMNGGLVETMLASARESLDRRLDVECGDVDDLLTITLEDLGVGLRFMGQSCCTDDDNKELIVKKEEDSNNNNNSSSNNEVIAAGKKQDEEADEISDALRMFCADERKKQVEEEIKATTTKQGATTAGLLRLACIALTALFIAFFVFVPNHIVPHNTHFLPT